MDPELRLIRPEDVEPCVRFGLEAFRPLFLMWEEMYGEALFGALRPDWETAQATHIRDMCSSEETETWIATIVDGAVGFVVVQADAGRRLGSIELLAVDPKHQGQGIGTVLNELAVQRLREMGVAFIVVGTGTDPGHAPARRSYEKAGFVPMPMHPFHYVMRLEEG
jgi:ribosomal protein S18 acetylase RimI-like enzyme